MDLLTDILKQAGLKQRILHQRALPPGQALQFPCGRSLGFHVVLQGEVYIHSTRSKAEPIVLHKGDVALMARGQEHIVSTNPTYRRSDRRDQVEMLGDPSVQTAKPSKATQAEVTLVSGAYQFWNEPIHPFFSELPDWFVLRSETLATLDRLPLAMGLLGEEIKNPSLGTTNVTHGLLDVIFTYLVRRIVEVQGKQTKTWSHAIQDPQVRRVVELMHADCAHEWTLVELATKGGLSRAGLAQKFRQSMGQPPLQYLRSIRMQKAMQLLSETQDTLESIAGAVGYGDAFGLSKVFKKVVGRSPREFRTQDRESPGQDFRFR